MEDSREEHWRYVAEDGEDNSKIHSLGWDVYTKQKGKLIKKCVLVYVPHQRGGDIVWTCVKDDIIKENEDYKSIELRGFDYNCFEEEEGVGGSIGIIQVSLFYSSNSVVSSVLCQADGKMNELVDDNNRLYKSG